MESLAQLYPEFKGKGALITGAASGMGEATARLLASAGAHPVLADLDQAGLARGWPTA